MSTPNRALFDVDADGHDDGFDATLGATHHFKLRATTGVNSWLLQVFSPDGFAYGIPILDNAPEASKNAPLLTLVGDTTGQSVARLPVTGEITATMPATGTNSWIVRSVVNGGYTKGHPDPSLVHERLIVTRSIVNGLRKPVVTELRQFEAEAWAGVICDLVDAANNGGLAGLPGPPGPGTMGVRLATAQALPANNRVGNVITATANGALVVDGVAVAANNRILLKDEATAQNNGIWVVTSTGGGGSPYVLTRASDTLSFGMLITIGGGAQAGLLAILLTPDPIVVNTTALSFALNGDGIHIVPTTTARDAIPAAIRREGLEAYVQADKTYYRLDTDLVTWVGVATGVSSFNTRTGAVMPAANDYTSTQVSNASSVTGGGTTVTSALNALQTQVSASVSGVSSVFGRVGAIAAALGDYTSSLVSNSSTVTGTTVTAALNALATSIVGLTSSAISNVSTVAGTTVTDALNTLLTRLNLLIGVKRAPDIATRNTMATSAGVVVYVESTQLYYALDPDLTTWKPVDANPALAKQANWYIDPVSGSDDNPGTIGAKLKTWYGLRDRLNPGGAQFRPQQVTNVYIAAGTIESLELTIGAPPGSNFDFFVNCDYSSGPSITLSSVTD